MRSSRVRPHPFDLDESLADPYETHRRAQLDLPPRWRCGSCGLPGRPGDARHTGLTVQQLQALWREMDAARTGEKVEA